MQKYQVIEQCYIPVGPGLKRKVPGQVVTLDARDAAALEGYIVPADEGVQELNTRPKRTSSRKAKSKKAEPETEPDEAEAEADLASAKAVPFVPVQESDEEVTPDAGEPTATDERVAGEDRG